MRVAAAGRLPLGARAFRHSASIAQRRPSDLLGRLGLRGELPDVDRRTDAAQRSALPPEPFELWAFRAGIKPVVFLTVRPDAGRDARSSYFAGAHCERRERRVQVDTQDRWTDRRDRGRARASSCTSRAMPLWRERGHGCRRRKIQRRALRELGALAGYPPCCVDAFARQDDRANNSRNRYHSYARTLRAARRDASPWPWQLNNLHTMIWSVLPLLVPLRGSPRLGGRGRWRSSRDHIPASPRTCAPSLPDRFSTSITNTS